MNCWKVSTPPTKFFGPLVSSIVTIPPIILPKPLIIDKVCSPPTKNVDPLPSSYYINPECCIHEY